MLHHTNVKYDIISSKFQFKGAGLKFKVAVAIFRKKQKTKNIVIALTPTCIDGF